MVHVFADWALDGTGVSSFLFFFIQAFAITVEDAVLDIGKKFHPKIGEGRWVRVVGYLWTIAWFSWSTVLLADWTLRAGMSKTRGIPFSIVVPAMKLCGIDVYDIGHLYPPVVLSTSS